jgi:hypothetical protein
VTGPVAADANWFLGLPALHFGRSNVNPGIKIFHSLTTNSLSGEWAWLQLITSINRYRTCGTNVWMRSESAGLDGGFPASGTDPDFNFLDIPGTEMVASDCESTRDDAFYTFWMFKPSTSGAIWIPLKRVEWNWGGGAERIGAGIQLISGSGYFSANSTAVDAPGFPA